MNKNNQPSRFFKRNIIKKLDDFIGLLRGTYFYKHKQFDSIIIGFEKAFELKR